MRPENRDVSFSAGGQWVVVSGGGELVLRRRKGDGWEELGTRIPLDHDCLRTEWLTDDEELICFGKDAVSVIAVGPDLIDRRLDALIQRTLTDEERKLFALEAEVPSPRK
jgi:hypothetical protein